LRQLILAHSERPITDFDLRPSAPSPYKSRGQRRVEEIDRDRIVGDAAQLGRVIAQLSAPQFWSCHACILVRRSPKPPIGMPSLIRHGTALGSTTTSFELATIASFSLCTYA
jgi:hypothetical protein